MKVIFDPVVESILELITVQMAQMDDIKLMMVVGGFAASPYLMKRINDTFIHQVKEVISPPDSGSAVCKGPVALGINKESIMSRIAGKTYGIDFSPLFDAQLDPLEYMDSQKNPRYTTDEGTVLEGTMVVDMSKNLEPGKDRKVEVSMFFGRTSIEVKAHGINFGDHKGHCMLPVNMESNWV
ncbi:unnamed protein product [Sphagnum jensenii]|uniref:Uncharacterized protein n=1 Tax=Sphagnum jensenii TaxID=128206 RepID=A0ABP1ACU8_9BRYO